ncbi:MAG TPA: hypothetical protein VGJ56_06350, partial [Reyranella sp.]
MRGESFGRWTRHGPSGKRRLFGEQTNSDERYLSMSFKVRISNGSKGADKTIEVPTGATIL